MYFGGLLCLCLQVREWVPTYGAHCKNLILNIRHCNKPYSDLFVPIFKENDNTKPLSQTATPYSFQHYAYSYIQWIPDNRTKHSVGTQLLHLFASLQSGWCCINSVYFTHLWLFFTVLSLDSDSIWLHLVTEWQNMWHSAEIITVRISYHK